MRTPKANFSVNVDVSNPGQFFACCGLLELAHRLWPGAEGWFEGGVFCIASSAADASLESLADRLRSVKICPDDAAQHKDNKTCPLYLRDNAGTWLSMRLDWWLDDNGAGGSLKTWAGQQSVTVISRAMLYTALSDKRIDERWLDCGKIAHDPDSPSKVVEPFYFDARRFSHPLNTGFSLDVQQASTTTHPAAEFLALVGLERFRPGTTSERRSFEYWSWPQALSVQVAASVACGSVPMPGRRGYRFPLRFRDGQKRYKAFGFATHIGERLS